MRIEIDQLNGKIRNDKSPSQNGKGKPDQYNLRRRRWLRHGHPSAPVLLCPNKWDNHLHDGYRKGQNQTKMGKLNKHARRIAQFIRFGHALHAKFNATLWQVQPPIQSIGQARQDQTTDH